MARPGSPSCSRRSLARARRYPAAAAGEGDASARGELCGRRIVSVHLLELIGVDLREAALGAPHLGKALELLHRARLGDVLVEELPHRLEGRGVVFLLFLVELGEPRENLSTLRG